MPGLKKGLARRSSGQLPASKRSARILLGAALLAVIVSPDSAAAIDEPGRRVPDPGPTSPAQEVIVKFTAEADREAQAGLLAQHGLTELRRLALIDALVAGNGGQVPDRVADALARSPLVEYAEPDYRIAPFPDLKSEPGFGYLWGLHNTGQSILGTTGVPDIDVNLPEAHLLTSGTSQVVVAVIDDGLDFSHPDLAARAWVNPGESGSGRETNGVDDDGNGLVDDLNGWDFLNEDRTIHDFDQDEHGTHVAGTIAASLDGQGVVGVAPAIKLMGLKFIGSGGGTVSDAIDAIEYASLKGAHIINASWGGPNFSTPLKQALEASGVLFVAAAGNDGSNNDVAPIYPASYSSSNIVAVAAIHNRGELTAFSNYGESSVDLAAPGQDILSTLPQTSEHPAGWGWGSGTSMATPHVSGAAALAGTVNPALLLDPLAMRSALLETIKELPWTSGVTATSGMLDAWGVANPFTDIATSIFRYDISWAYGRRITFGCSATTYCPDADVTRAQMASFLVRALGLTDGGSIDYFTDDAGSHEVDINRLRHARITSGCSETKYCPLDRVSRAQMGAFLRRAFGS